MVSENVPEQNAESASRLEVRVQSQKKSVKAVSDQTGFRILEKTRKESRCFVVYSL